MKIIKAIKKEGVGNFGSCKSQMKIQEMAFVLIALMLLFSMVFIFYIKLKSSDIEETSYGLKQNKALSLLDRITSMPELSCSAVLGADSLCIDQDKLEIMQTNNFQEEYRDFWQNVKEIKIKKVYPDEDSFVIFSSAKPGFVNESYSSFTRICSQKYDNTGWYECSIGVVSITI